MDLLQAMLQRDPKDRISAKDALAHPALTSVLSKTPLVKRQFNAEALLSHTRMVEKLRQQPQPP